MFGKKIREKYQETEEKNEVERGISGRTLFRNGKITLTNEITLQVNKKYQIHPFERNGNILLFE